MSKTPFMPLWVSDFLGDTLDLDAAEIGAYMLLLMAQWNRDGASLPNDETKLRRVARCGRNWPKIWDAIGRYFDHDGAGIYSNRLRLEAQNVAAKREVNAHNGARGGYAKALKSKEPHLANATNSPQRNPSSHNHNHKDEKRDTIVSPKKTGSRLPDDWYLPEEYCNWAVGEGWSVEAIRFEADRFKDYWCAKPGKDATKLDWQATWRNWIRNNSKGKTNGNGNYSNGAANGRGMAKQSLAHEVADRAIRITQSREATGGTDYDA